MAPRITGIAIRKENAAASSAFRPNHRAVTTVVPEREIPGIRANAWAKPITSAPIHPGRSTADGTETLRLVQRITPVTIRATPGMTGFSNITFTKSLRKRPVKTAGRVAKVTKPVYSRALRSLPRTPFANSIIRLW